MIEKIKFLLKPIPLAIQLTAAVVGITTANYDFKTANITMAAALSPTQAQAKTYVDRLVKDGVLKFRGGEIHETQLIQHLKNNEFPRDLKSFNFFVNNYSETDANDVHVKLALWRNGKIIHSNYLHGSHDLKAVEGQFSGSMPLNVTLENVDEITMCASYRGRFYIDKTVEQVRLAKMDNADLPFDFHSSELSAALPLEVWGQISGRDKQLFQFGEACTDWTV